MPQLTDDVISSNSNTNAHSFRPYICSVCHTSIEQHTSNALTLKQTTSRVAYTQTA